MRAPLLLWFLAAFALPLTGCPGSSAVDDDDDSQSDDDDSQGDDDDDSRPDPGTWSWGRGGGLLTHELEEPVLGTRYGVYAPPSYDPRQGWPVLIHLHWGDRGTSILAEQNDWEDRSCIGIHELPEELGFLYVAPWATFEHEIGNGHIFFYEPDTIEETHRIIEHLATLWNVDLSRIYLTGHAYAGSYALYHAIHDPSLLAAAASVGGGVDREGVGPVGGDGWVYPDSPPDDRLPLWIGHRPDNLVMPFATTEELIEDLDAASHPYVLETELPEHFCEDSAHGEIGDPWGPPVTRMLWDWLSTQERPEVAERFDQDHPWLADGPQIEGEVQLVVNGPPEIHGGWIELHDDGLFAGEESLLGAGVEQETRRFSFPSAPLPMGEGLWLRYRETPDQALSFIWDAALWLPPGSADGGDTVDLGVARAVGPGSWEGWRAALEAAGYTGDLEADGLIVGYANFTTGEPALGATLEAPAGARVYYPLEGDGLDLSGTELSEAQGGLFVIPGAPDGTYQLLRGASQGPAVTAGSLPRTATLLTLTVDGP